MKHASRINTHLTALLAELPPESVQMVEQFARFLRQQAKLGRPVGTVKENPPRYLYPTVPVPASAIDNLIGILPPVGGDALADTEALYDRD